MAKSMLSPITAAAKPSTSHTGKEDYVKGHLPLLAKTDFATMFTHLSDGGQKKYGKVKSDRKKFAALVLESVTQDPTCQYGPSACCPYAQPPTA